VSDDTLGNIKVLKWPELPLTSDERTIDGLIDALLEAETAEQIIGCRNELLTAWMGRQAWNQALELAATKSTADEYRKQIENEALERAAQGFDSLPPEKHLDAGCVARALREMKG
jgi:hypothetical protein